MSRSTDNKISFDLVARLDANIKQNILDCAIEPIGNTPVVTLIEETGEVKIQISDCKDSAAVNPFKLGGMNNFHNILLSRMYTSRG